MSLDSRAFALGPIGGTGPALLCLHGLTGTPYEVRPPPALHRDLGIACLGPELPGHCTTLDELGSTTHAEWVRCALEHYDRLARTHTRVYVLGLSLGGVLALRVAQERPIAGALVLAAPIDLGRWVRLVVPILSRFKASIAKTPAILDAAARAVHPGYRRMPLSAVVQLIRLQADVVAGLPAVTAPLRLLYSRSDPTVSVRDAEWIVRAASSAPSKVTYIQRSRHVITVDLERQQVEQWIVEMLVELEKDPLHAVDV